MKLDFKTNKFQWCQDNGSVPSKNSSGDENNEQQPPQNHFEDVLTALGLNPRRNGIGPDIGFRYIGMDWAFMLRVANAQAALAILSIICLTSSMLLTAFNFYRFTSSAWATYLLSCAYIGMRAGRWQSYPHAVAYCGMCTFQSLVYMSTMCWLFYSVYALNSNAQSHEFIRSNTTDVALVFTLGEVLSIMGTVLTGIFGLIGCCRGFGRLLHAQEKMILDYQNVLAGAHGSVRPLHSA